MSKFIHTVPSGVSNSLHGAPGSIMGIAELTKPNGDVSTAADFDNASMVAEGIAFVQIPDDAYPQIGSVLGTALAAGTGNAPFATVAALETGMSLPPAKGLFFNGSIWTGPAGSSSGQVATLSIITAGTGYTTGTGKSVKFTTVSNTSAGIEKKGLTVDITSVDGSGGVTGVSVNSAGFGHAVGDRVSITSGANNAILQVDSVVRHQLGTFNTARPTANPNRLSPSYFPNHPPGITGSDIYLEQPTTGAKVYFDDTLAGNFRFSSGTVDIFDGSDFTLQVKGVQSDNLFGTLTMPAAANTNANVNFNAAY